MKTWPVNLEDLFPLFGSPEIVTVGQACEGELDSMTVITTDVCNFTTITRTWYLIDGAGLRSDSL